MGRHAGIPSWGHDILAGKSLTRGLACQYVETGFSYCCDWVRREHLWDQDGLRIHLLAWLRRIVLFFGDLTATRSSN